MGAVLQQLLRINLQRRFLAFREEAIQGLKRQAMEAGLLLGLVAGGALAALLTLLIGLLALFVAVEERNGPLIALGVVGAVTALTAALLLGLAAARSRSKKPPLRVSATTDGPAGRPLWPGAAIRGDTSAAEVLARRAAATGTGVVEGASDIMRNGSRPAMLGLIALVAVAGMLIGRRS
jgi:hypothetical protein